MTIGIKIAVEATRYGGLDPAAAAFLTAAGITDPTITNAINRLVKNYKGQGNLNTSVDLWSGSLAIYPFVGGTATTNMYNLKDPRNLDEAFRLAFSGGWVHNANGSTPNGFNAFAELFITPSVHLSQNSAFLSYYSGTNISASQIEIGSIGGSGFGCYLLYSFNGSAFKAINSAEANTGTIASPTTGYLCGGRNNATQEFYTHRTSQHTITRNSSAPNNISMVLGAYRNITPVVNFFSSKRCQFASVENGRSLSEQLILSNIVEQFQTDLARNV